MIEYLAGYIDADGYLGLAPVTRPDRPRYLYPQLQVGGIVRSPLDALQKEFGGTIHPKMDRRKTEQQMFLWHLSGKARLEPVLQALLPYLLVKQSQARLLLRYFRECYRPQATWPRLTQTERERREVYKQLLSRLKQGDIARQQRGGR